MHILFDLDGTLTDSSPGIMRCFAHALDQIGRPVEDLSRLVCLGPPMPRTFQMLLGSDDPDLIERAIVAFRERFSSVGMFENSLYPHVPEMLAALCQSGHRMHIVTAKARPYAITILQHFTIDHYFDAVHGPSLDDRTYNKGDLIAQALSAVDPTEAIMVGDRGEDILAAKQNGIRSIAVRWGYRSVKELDRVTPDYVVHTPYQLVQRLTSGADSV